MPSDPSPCLFPGCLPAIPKEGHPAWPLGTWEDCYLHLSSSGGGGNRHGCAMHETTKHLMDLFRFPLSRFF